MNHLRGKYVNVVLAIEMGRGMDFLEHPVKIVANFNGRPIESDLVTQDECPMFHAELVWEMEKKELRKVRSANAPLRIELFSVDPKSRKDRIGFALLSPRCASIVPFESKLEIPFKWQKLLGVVPEHKNKHPELYLSLTIRDLSTTTNQLDSTYLPNVTIDEENETPSDEAFHIDGRVVPIRYMPDGYVKIGKENCDETFLLSISIQVAYNLDLLLPEVLVFHHNREKYYISFRMFGITIKSKPFCRDLHANIPMNEKIVIRLTSGYNVLRTYLSEHCKIAVNFFCGRDRLGTTKLCVDNLLNSLTEEAFEAALNSVSYEQKCLFKFPSLHGIIPSGTDGREPYIEVETVLKRTEVRPSTACTEESEIEVIGVVEGKVEIPSPGDLSPKEDHGCGDECSVDAKKEVLVDSPRVSACGDQNELDFQVKELPELELKGHEVEDELEPKKCEPIHEECGDTGLGFKLALDTFTGSEHALLCSKHASQKYEVKLNGSEPNLHQLELKLHRSESKLCGSEHKLQRSDLELHRSEHELQNSESNLHGSKPNLEGSESEFESVPNLEETQIELDRPKPRPESAQIEQLHIVELDEQGSDLGFGPGHSELKDIQSEPNECESELLANQEINDLELGEPQIELHSSETKLELVETSPTEASTTTSRVSSATKKSVRSSKTSISKIQSPHSPKTLITFKDLDAKTFLYQQYCLDIILESITLKKNVKSSKLLFKFKHPKASSVVVSDVENHYGEDIILENAKCKMFFVSSTEHIRKMVYAWPPKLVMADGNDQTLTEELDLYTAMFLAKNRTECSYITEWKAVRTYEPLAKISISMYLQAYGLNALPNETGYELLPPVLDEHIAVKELQDLQAWKEKEKAQFSADLKIMEKQRVGLLQRHWTKRKRELEHKLNASVTRCQTLSQELQTAVNIVRTHKALEQKQNGNDPDFLEGLHEKYAEYANRDLIEKISKLAQDNGNLKEIINEQRQEIQQIKKTALTKEQTTSLLQQLRGLEEKFEDAQKAKTYFKNQYKKAVREIHDLRAEDQKQIRERIQNQKVELSQISLDSFFQSNNNYDCGFDSSFGIPSANSFTNFKREKLNFP